MKYRADIDGLRAIAVIPVVLYHSDIAMFSGGFVGVDVFFVISGYLITELITHELREGKFTLLNFYERRVRRILPALFTVITFTLVAGWFVLLPNHYVQVGQSTDAAIGFVSNIFFWLEAGYFSVGAELHPLLHTWSLAVEEQFYIFFPLLILFLTRFASRFILPVLAAGALVSLTLSISLAEQSPSATFFLIPTRAWELAAGSLLALGLRPNPQTAYRGATELVGLAGLAMILSPVFFYDGTTVFPGIAALPPVLGTMALIWCGATPIQPFASRILRLRPLVIAGQISYSLYLWHWPLLVFARHWELTEKLDLKVALPLVCLSIFFSVLSWRFVETPFRNRRTISRRGVFVSSAMAACLLFIAGGLIWNGQGFFNRLPPEARVLAQGANDYSPIGLRCSNVIPDAGVISKQCVFGSRDGLVDFAVWGTSHAGAIVPAFEQLAGANNRRGVVYTGPNCFPLEGVVAAWMTPPNRDDCLQRTKSILAGLAANDEILDVFLVGNWPALRRTQEYFIEMGSVSAADDGIRFRKIVDSFRQTIRVLRQSGKEVFVITDLPKHTFNVPWVKASQTFRHVEITDRDDPVSENLGKEMLVAIESEGAHRIRLDNGLCNQDGCLTVLDGRAVYTDSNHLSIYAGRKIIAGIIASHWLDNVQALQ